MRSLTLPLFLFSFFSISILLIFFPYPIHSQYVTTASCATTCNANVATGAYPCCDFTTNACTACNAANTNTYKYAAMASGTVCGTASARYGNCNRCVPTTYMTTASSATNAAQCTLCSSTNAYLTSNQVSSSVQGSTTATRSSWCNGCIAGYYQTAAAVLGASAAVCAACPSGNYCTGTYSVGGQTSCNSVSTGSTGSGGTSAVNAGSCDQCSAGYYMTATATGSTAATCAVCPAGYYCPGTSSLGGQISCNSASTGTTNSGGSTATNVGTCNQCIAGYQMNTAAVAGSSAAVCSACPSGSYCPGTSSVGGAVTCTSVSTGSSGNGGTGATTAGSCTYCIAGYYINTAASGSTAANCLTCTSASTGSTSSSSTGTTPIGSTVATKSSTCIQCSPGYNMTSAAVSTTSPAQCAACSAGYYCQGTSSVGGANSCNSASTGSSNTGGITKTSLSSCDQCIAGYQMTNAAVAGVSAAVCSSCPSGAYCPGATSVPGYVSCPTGSSGNGGLTAIDASACDRCLTGYSMTALAAPSTAASCSVCAAGYFCNGTSIVGGSYSCNVFSNGASSAGGAGSISISSCSICAIGYFIIGASTASTAAICSSCDSASSGASSTTVSGSSPIGVTTTTMSSSCDTCQVGFSITQASSPSNYPATCTPVLCPVNYYYNTLTAACASCGIGGISDGQLSTSCVCDRNNGYIGAWGSSRGCVLASSIPLNSLCASNQVNNCVSFAHRYNITDLISNGVTASLYTQYAKIDLGTQRNVTRIELLTNNPIVVYVGNSDLGSNAKLSDITALTLYGDSSSPYYRSGVGVIGHSLLTKYLSTRMRYIYYYAMPSGSTIIVNEIYVYGN